MSEQSGRVDLILIGDATGYGNWPLGEVRAVEPSPRAVQRCIEAHLGRTRAAHWLFWSAKLGMPTPETMTHAADRPGDVWHAGLRLGMAGLPRLIDFVSPVWMLNRDPDPTLETTSWRLSLAACLIRVDVLKQMGSIDPDFETLEGAGLELGHRLITRGALVRHVPWLVPGVGQQGACCLPLQDELRFMRRRFGRRWSGWAAARAILTGDASLWGVFRAWRKTAGVDPLNPEPYARRAETAQPAPGGMRVSVIIPTLDRYPYLRTLLGQLRRQTVPPAEIIVIDQTAEDRRDARLAEEFADLPLRVIYQDTPGQCTARNAGLSLAGGDAILFVDDDDEVGSDLIEAHLRNLGRFGADVSSGAAHEVGAGPLPENFTYTRASDVFPTNNTLIRRAVLHRSGLFDLAYDRRKRADGDLGMRVYLSGAVMVHSPETAVLHHHAPQGGLRVHRARVVTYASSRKRVGQRHLPSASEVYLAMRYFTPRQVREMLWLRVLGTFSIRGGVGRKVCKAVAALALLPHTWWVIQKRRAEARDMLGVYPQIPTLSDPAALRR